MSDNETYYSDLEEKPNSNYGIFLFIFKFIMFDFITGNRRLFKHRYRGTRNHDDRVDMNIDLNNETKKDVIFNYLKSNRFFQNNILLNCLFKTYDISNSSQTYHYRQIVE